MWHGDLDLTVDEDALVALAERIGDTIFVLYESDGRFDREDDPLLVTSGVLRHRQRPHEVGLPLHRASSRRDAPHATVSRRDHASACAGGSSGTVRACCGSG